MTCKNCGRPERAHVNGRCTMDIHVVLDAQTIERAIKVGHPRLTRAVLLDEQRTALTEVHVERVRFVEQ